MPPAAQHAPSAPRPHSTLCTRGSNTPARGAVEAHTNSPRITDTRQQAACRWRRMRGGGGCLAGSATGCLWWEHAMHARHATHTHTHTHTRTNTQHARHHTNTCVRDRPPSDMHACTTAQQQQSEKQSQQGREGWAHRRRHHGGAVTPSRLLGCGCRLAGAATNAHTTQPAQHMYAHVAARMPGDRGTEGCTQTHTHTSAPGSATSTRA
jgi:hypothetical protein